MYAKFYSIPFYYMADTHLNGLIKRHNALSPLPPTWAPWKKVTINFYDPNAEPKWHRNKGAPGKVGAVFWGGQDPYVAGPHEGAKSKRLLAFAFNQLWARSFPRLLAAQPDNVPLRPLLYAYMYIYLYAERNIC